MKEFEKIIGYKAEKRELERIADMMVNSDKYQALGVHTTRGLLLHGNPGVGKTLMAKCLIEASGRPAFTVRKDLPDGDFVKYIREAFENAKTEAPSIVFLDDMDKFSNQDRFHMNTEEFVAIQSCIDDCHDSEVFVLATTNNIDNIPDSLLREGRFDKTITVREPKGKDAEEIVRHFLMSKKCAADVDPKTVSRLLNGSSCAFLETIVNEAGVYAGFENRTEISMDDMTRAFMRSVLKSPERFDEIDKRYLQTVAYHEAGHALMAEILEPGSVPFVTVSPYGGDVEGFTHVDRSNNYFRDITFMENRVKILLAGKAAIEIVYGANDVGCTEDLNRAFRIVQRFTDDYCCYGFNVSEEICNLNRESSESKRVAIIGFEMEQYYQQAKKALTEKRSCLDALAKELAEKKILVDSDIQRLIAA